MAPPCGDSPDGRAQGLEGGTQGLGWLWGRGPAAWMWCGIFLCFWGLVCRERETRLRGREQQLLLPSHGHPQLSAVPCSPSSFWLHLNLQQLTGVGEADCVPTAQIGNPRPKGVKTSPGTQAPMLGSPAQPGGSHPLLGGPEDPGEYQLTCSVPPADEVAASSPVGTDAARGGGRRHRKPEVNG